MASSAKDGDESLVAERAQSDSFYSCRAVEPARLVPSMAEEIAAGFAARPRSVPAKYFYDAHGSELFERI